MFREKNISRMILQNKILLKKKIHLSITYKYLLEIFKFVIILEMIKNYFNLYGPIA